MLREVREIKTVRQLSENVAVNGRRTERKRGREQPQLADQAPSSLVSRVCTGTAGAHVLPARGHSRTATTRTPGWTSTWPQNPHGDVGARPSPPGRATRRRESPPGSLHVGLLPSRVDRFAADPRGEKGRRG
jgi:hypothetical protein